MSEKYDPAEIEKKWQKKWEDDGLYHADIDPDRPKHYAMTMLPYPSGDLHIGHWFAMTPSDARARFMRMNGFNVMFPMGFDAFGLPAENAAIKHNVHPKEWTYSNIERMRKQMNTMGTMFDWRREMISSDPEYYRWTQWFFQKLYKGGMAYRKMAAVDFCPTDNTTLAREQVVGEEKVCERCGTPVVKKNLEQWFFKITDYADELLKFELIDWPERVKLLQTNWIGRSEGARVVFKTEGGDDLEVFTTRPDTLWGATFMVLAPEHPLVDVLTTDEQRQQVEAYKLEASRQTEIEREATDKEKTGVFTGGYAVNPVNDEKIPVWIADYVLMGYGTGAIMAVPAHDQRDFEFARQFGLEVRPVIQQEGGPPEDGETMEAAAAIYGTMINSGKMTGTPADQAVSKTIAFIEEQGKGKGAVNYRIRDWLISRQRYWGAPIPMVHCKTCGVQPVPEDQLPVELPEDIEWRPTGESPLKFHPTWKQTTCPNCSEPAERDTDTMDTFMCSSWYHLRYLSPDYAEGPFDPNEYDYWMPVDTYTGGIEHATMHLLYTRFYHKAMRDLGIVEGHEPMAQLRNQGIVLGEDYEKMSKSRGNVVAPDVLVDQYGADTVRSYLMFFSRWDQGGPWNSQGIEGSARWLRRVWTAFTEPVNVGAQPSEETVKELRRKLHKTLKSVTDDFEKFEFNTVISSLMELMNDMYRARDLGAYGSPAWKEAEEIYILMMAPVAPHMAEELWGKIGKRYSVHTHAWPVVDENAAKDEEITLVVQVNGKLRDRITIEVGASEDMIKELALASPTARKFMDGQEPKKVIVIGGKLVNIVV
ncbi:MAG: leucine--tRNA ligase [Anaerolineae bacterium]|nr:leucine--tRNA ligase [Anaerolineae bacterium]